MLSLYNDNSLASLKRIAAVKVAEAEEALVECRGHLDAVEAEIAKRSPKPAPKAAKDT